MHLQNCFNQKCTVSPKRQYSFCLALSLGTLAFGDLKSSKQSGNPEAAIPSDHVERPHKDERDSRCALSAWLQVPKEPGT